MRRTLLLDADIIAFKFTSATERVYYWDGADSEPSVAADLDEAKRCSKEYIEELQDKLHADSVIVCLTDTENFRKSIYPAYKSQRVDRRKPEFLAAVKQWLTETYKTYQRPSLEADDCMGILATHPTLIPGEKIMVSEDKDMKTVPGLLFNPARDSEPQRISRLEADRFHLWQTIVGDPADGYPGAYGCGPQSEHAVAVAASRTVEEAWSHVVAAFTTPITKGKCKRPALTVDDAITQARLARILRATDWDFRARKPRLWCPPGRRS